jgi:N6-adenosine-specific RNA methylase IME4
MTEGKKYTVLYADPPWRFDTYSEKGEGRSAANHYDVMTTRDIAALPISDLAAPSCALFMWATMPMLPEAYRVMADWGFIYKTVAFTWMKQRKKSTELFMGTGYWTRANAEICLLGTRGSPKRLHNDVMQAILEPVREHSRKPDCVYDRIERLMGDVPRLELFSRTSKPGWDAFGNQLGKFTPDS